MNPIERGVIQDATNRLLQLVADVVMPTAVLAQLVNEISIIRALTWADGTTDKETAHDLERHFRDRF